MLNFIKRHYEKIILTFLLIIFVVLLVVQLSMILSARNISYDELNFKKRNPDFIRLNFKDPKYNALLALSSASMWDPSGARFSGDKIWTDFLTPLDLAKCPYCKHLIPVGDFAAGKCSFCLKTLKPAVKRSSKIDSDGDGIPDEDAIRLGLNPKASEGDLDFDGDGFTNAEEFLAGTDMRNPKSHPSYAEKLAVVEVVHKRLNIKVLTVKCNDPDKSKWEVQVQLFIGGKERTRFISFANSSIKCDEGEYKLVDIVPDYVSKLDPTTNSSLIENHSKALLQRSGSAESLTGEIGKDIIEGRERTVFHCGIGNKQLEYFIGDSFKVGTDKGGYEKFTLVSSDAAAATAVLKRDDGKDAGKTVEIQKWRPPAPKNLAPQQEPGMMGPGPGGMPLGPNGQPLMPPR